MESRSVKISRSSSSFKMKILAAVALMLCVQQSLGMLGYIKPIKIWYKQTGTRCKGLHIFLTPVNRYETTFTAVCDELRRPVEKGFVNVRVSFKTSTMQNFRQIVSLRNLEPCKIYEDRKLFPMLNYMIDRAKELYPEYVHACPYTEAKFYNLSCSFMQNPIAKDLAELKKFQLLLPNAIYKLEGEGWDGSGDAFNITGWLEAKYKKRNVKDPREI